MDIELKSVEYYSQLDEDAFFEWLDKFDFVSGYKGIGRSLFVTVKENEINRDSIDALAALFQRYRINIKELEKIAIERGYWEAV